MLAGSFPRRISQKTQCSLTSAARSLKETERYSDSLDGDSTGAGAGAAEPFVAIVASTCAGSARGSEPLVVAAASPLAGASPGRWPRPLPRLSNHRQVSPN